MQNIFQDFGIEVDIKEPQNFLKIKETLTRMGVASKKDNTLYQSCHILHKRGKYAILHFKELFMLDGKVKETTIEEEDIERRNTITSLLEEWKLLTILHPEQVVNCAEMSEVKVIPFKDKTSWKLVPKYQVGTKSKEVLSKK